MPIFRDLDGNFYDIPKDQLRKYKVEGELPDTAKQTGAEIDAQAGSRPGPGYFWDVPQPPAYVWEPRPSNYFWDPRVQQQGPRPAAYFYDRPGHPQYFWDRPAPVRPEPVEAPAAEPRAAAYTYAEAGTPSEPAPIKTKKTRSSKKASRAG